MLLFSDDGLTEMGLQYRIIMLHLRTSDVKDMIIVR